MDLGLHQIETRFVGVVEVRHIPVADADAVAVVREEIWDPQSAAFVRAAHLLSETGIDVGALIVNRILPDGLSGDFYASRKAQEATYLTEIARRFPRLPRTDVRQLPRDVYGLDTLGEISRQLVA